MSHRQHACCANGLRSASRAALVLILCFPLVAAAAAQEIPQSTGPILRVTTEAVNVYAVVRDKHHRLIPDLTKDDFEIKEDNIFQKITYFTRETDTPLTLAIMVDTSPSQERVLDVEQREAKNFLSQVLRPKDLACVIHFDLEVELLQDFTADVHTLDSAIDETVINGGAHGVLPSPLPASNIGGTHLYDSIYLAASELMSHEVGRKVLILLTDGEDQGSKESLNQALEAAQKSDCIIYAVDIVDRTFYRFSNMGFNGDAVLRKLCEQTGGDVIKVTKIQNTSEAFQRIAEELRTQYLLGYTPSNPRKDPGFRKINVRVIHGDYKIQTRSGYYPHS
ncbi:MAG: VWA domain-containing protein [Acidobacteria bacterium]|nr:MAG: VWA domain-containing protein [Acidobacteriota bacterium]